MLSGLDDLKVIAKKPLDAGDGWRDVGGGWKHCVGHDVLAEIECDWDKRWSHGCHLIVDTPSCCHLKPDIHHIRRHLSDMAT